MKMTPARSCAVALAFAAFAAHSQVLIDPVVVELGAKQRAAPLTLTLSARASGPLTLQTEVLRWHQDATGDSRYEPTGDLLVVPPIIQLKPGESQLVRIAFRGARQGPAEQAYRLMLEDVTAATRGQADDDKGISFRMRYDLPVMLGAAVAHQQSLQWSRCAADAPNRACVRVANEGTRRVTLRHMEVRGAGWSLPVEHPGTVLAQGVREWRFALPQGAQGAALSVAGETNRAEPVGAQFAQH